MVAFTRFFIVCLVVVLVPVAAFADDQDERILHVLNRISYGPAPGDIEAVRRIGIDAYIEQQLHPASFPTPRDLQDRLNQLPITRMSLMDIADRFQPDREEGKLSQEKREELNQHLRTIVEDMSDAKILNAAMDPAQLQEVMTDFWFNHFNVFFNKALDRVFISTYERDAIRPYALGKFRDLLEATARHPAMIFYLDNAENTDPNSPFARRVAMRQGKELGINENYAREVMELHTLGVNGGYTQQDVTVLAHILTGWGLGHGKSWAEKSTFAFDPMRHDTNDQVFLGQTIRGGGGEEIEHVLDILARHPSTAHHIAFQLAQYFVADQPPESLVDHLAKVFQSTDGDIAAMLRALFRSPEFNDPQYAQNKFKPPFRYVVSALRAANVEPPEDMHMLEGSIAGMGEPLYRCPTPNGYANTNDQWLNSDALLKRINLAKGMARFLNDHAAATIMGALGQRVSADTLRAVQDTKPPMQPVLLLSSPEFLYY